jgi:predicted secreted protein
VRTATLRSGLGVVLAALAALTSACSDDDADDADDTALATIVADEPVDATTIDTEGTSVGGTSSAETAGGTGTVVVTEPSLPVTASVGQSIAVPLRANPSTGYSWNVLDPGDPSVLTFVDRSYESSDPDADGSGGVETLVFLAQGAGETVVVLAYSFEGDVPTTDPAELVELTVTVR